MVILNKKRENLITLENAFQVLKEDPQIKSGKDMLKSASEKIFPYTFQVYINTEVNNTTPLFVMSVYPDMSTVNKIISAISKNETNMIGKLWAQTKNWTIEIDSRILNENFVDLSPRELTAIYCHELGHIILSNSIPNRLITILQYELAKTSIGNKTLIRDNLFRKILSLPVLNACTMEKKDSIKDEIKADKFVKEVGYQKELITVMQKFQNCSSYKGDTPDSAMKKMASFTTDALDQFRKREATLTEKTLLRMRKECNSVYLENALDDILYSIFNENGNTSMTKERKMEYVYERAESLEEEFIATEFFGLNKKTLKRIDPAELDYIAVKVKDIQSNADKMMLISYAHSKLDIVEYYISLLNNPKERNKYRIPYTEKELIDIRNRLKSQIEDIINAKLPGKLSGILVAWPDGYEG